MKLERDDQAISFPLPGTMKVVVAQGGGYYGCAFFTTYATDDQIMKALAKLEAQQKEGDFHMQSHPSARHPQFTQIVATRESLHGTDWETTTLMTVPPDPGFQPQPEPVVLFDSGNFTTDLKFLRELKAALEE